MFCSKCGTKVIDGALFCQKCGAKVENTDIQKKESICNDELARETNASTVYEKYPDALGGKIKTVKACKTFMGVTIAVMAITFIGGLWITQVVIDIIQRDGIFYIFPAIEAAFALIFPIFGTIWAIRVSQHTIHNIQVDEVIQNEIAAGTLVEVPTKQIGGTAYVRVKHPGDNPITGIPVTVAYTAGKKNKL